MADAEVVVSEGVTSKDMDNNSPERKRATSPYHQRCFPPYCESVSSVDKQTLSKMKRADLEDRYIVYADENMALKKRIRDHEKQLQRLTVALARQDQADRKTGIKTAYDSIRADNLESQNKSLQAKVKVLTQQLMNHSFIHSKDNRLAEERTRKASPQPSQTARENPVGKSEDNSLKRRIAALEQMLETQKKKYNTRISQLEKELASASKDSTDLGDQISQHSKKLSDNLEIIKLRRQNNEMVEKLEALKDQLIVNEKELSQVQEAMKNAVDRSEDLEEKLKQEREKARDAQGLVAKSSSNTEIIRGLEEQIRDLQKEKEVLKETNEKLLELTTGPQSKSERSIHEANLKKQISLLENRLKDKIKELEEKEEQFIKMEALYEENKTSALKEVKSNTGSEKSHHKEEIQKLKEQLVNALDENEDMKKELEKLKASLEEVVHTTEDETENNELLKQNENLRHELENIRSQGDQEIENLKTQLAAALKEIDDLKKQLNEGAGEDHSKLEKELEEANNEITRLRLIVEDQVQGQVVVAEDSNLEKELEEAVNEINRLRVIADEHAHCDQRPSSPCRSERSTSTTTIYKSTSCIPNKSEQSVASGKCSSHIVVHKTSSHKSGEICEDMKAQLCNALIDNQKLRMALEKAGHDHDHKQDTVKDTKLKNELACALAEVERLKKIAAIHEQCPKDSHHVVSQRSKVIIREKTPFPSPVQSKTESGTPLVMKFEVTKLCSPTNIGKSRSDLGSIEENRPFDTKFSIEINNINYQKPEVSISLNSIAGGHDSERNPFKQTQSSSAFWRNELLSYQSRDDILRVCLIQGQLSKAPSLKSYSEHRIEEIPPEPVQKPNLLIVSKHEFDAILLKKKKYYTESEVTVLDDGKEILNCRMEICMYDLELDNNMLGYLGDLEDDPHVFLDWSFLGLDQRTTAMPAHQPLFYTNAVYYGPLSQNMTEYVKENTMPIYLMLAKSNTHGLVVGSGVLDLMPAIKNPGRVYMRSIPLKVDKGSATVHCSFKMHGCCVGDPAKAESIEVGIGQLQLKNAEEMPGKSTHLYIEYSLLGYCGGELETDSIPKSDVMRFNYTKRLRVSDHNASNLEPLLQSQNPQPLKFILLSEPCSLSKTTDVEEVGTAEVNLMEEMVEKDSDLISAHLPVTNKSGEELGTLSVTIIGIDTLLEHTEYKNKRKEKAR